MKSLGVDDDMGQLTIQDKEEDNLSSNFDSDEEK